MNIVTISAFYDELSKIADVLPVGEPVDISTLSDPNDPTDPITRYQSMQRRKPIARDVIREGALGAVLAPTTTLIGDLIGKGVKETFKRPELRNEAGQVVQQLGHFSPGGYGRRMMGAAAVGTLAASALPLLRSHMALKAEEENVKQHIGMTPHHGARSAVRRTLGVG